MQLSQIWEKRCSQLYTSVIEILQQLGAEVLLQHEMKREFEHEPVTVDQEIEKIYHCCDLVIAIGGDGTIIHATKYALLPISQYLVLM